MCALGLCTLLELIPQRPHDIAQIAQRLLPSCCIIFENLEKVYQGIYVHKLGLCRYIDFLLFLQQEQKMIQEAKCMDMNLITMVTIYFDYNFFF